MRIKEKVKKNFIGYRRILGGGHWIIKKSIVCITRNTDDDINGAVKTKNKSNLPCQILKEFDINKDNKISEEEFLNLFQVIMEMKNW